MRFPWRLLANFDKEPNLRRGIAGCPNEWSEKVLAVLPRFGIRLKAAFWAR